MSTSLTSIYNLALTYIGQNPISDPAGSEAGAIACRQVYDICRKSLLEQYPWNFAIKRASLAQDIETPEYEYSYAYLLPSDCIRHVVVYNPSSSYLEENGKLLSNDDEINIKYVFDQTDPNYFSPLFVQLLAVDMAIAIEYKITNQTTMQGSLAAKRQELIIKSKMIEAQQNLRSNPIINSSTEAMYSTYGGDE